MIQAISKGARAATSGGAPLADETIHFMKAKKKRVTDLSGSMQTLLEYLFGSKSKQARSAARTPTEWRKTLLALLKEMDRYIAKNVDTDQVHQEMLQWSLAAAHVALEEDEDFWPGSVAGITRLALVLMGDYPQHRRWTPGRKSDDHYSLDVHRCVQWTQTPEQRFLTFIAAGKLGFPKLANSPQDVLDLFRERFGFKPSQAQFMEWYRKNLPEDYAALFR